MNPNATGPVKGEPAPQAPGMSFLQRIGSIGFEPGKTFEDVGRRPTWAGIFILMSILVGLTSYTLVTRMDHETMMRKSLKMNPMTRNMSEEQIQKIVSAPQSPIQKYSGIVAAPVVILLEFFALAGVFLLAFMLMGVSIPYKKVLSTLYWGMAPAMIVVTVLSLIFMYVKDPDTLEMNPAGNVASNLGALGLVDEKAHPALSSLLGSIDIFSLWTITLLSIGFSLVSNRQLSTGKAASGVLILWAVYVLGKAGLSLVFS
jgi:hypothetical protein